MSSICADCMTGMPDILKAPFISIGLYGDKQRGGCMRHMLASLKAIMKVFGKLLEAESVVGGPRPAGMLLQLHTPEPEHKADESELAF